ncbi:MAG: hypothetical protein MPJ78_07145 [Hyphomicrobiaceae bacterium]|nr:hypothetical protein [Hyphomicrobiaceae bacterium]
MGNGLIISLILHLAVLFSIIAVFPSSRPLPNAPTPLPVDLVTPAELTKIKAGERKAKTDAGKVEKKAKPAKKQADKKSKAAKTKTVKAPVPVRKPKPKKAKAPPKPVKKAVKTKPKPKPKPKKTVKKPAKKPPKKVASKPKPRPKAKKDFDPDKIAALLNKVPDAGPRTTASTEQSKRPDPANGRTSGQDLTMTFNELDALRAKISQCWNPPVGGLGAEAIRVRLRLQLGQDGTLTTTPQVVNSMASPFFQAAADAAVRAVMLCQPYKELPAKKYALWRDMILNFDPREMFGG